MEFSREKKDSTKLFCTDGSMVIRNFPEIYYSIPNESYFEHNVKGSVGICSKKGEKRILNQGGEQIFAYGENIFVSLSEHPALANYDSITYIISTETDKIVNSFTGNVVYINKQSKTLFYIRNSVDNRKGGLYCCDINGENEKKEINGNLEYLGSEGENLYFQSALSNKIEILVYNQAEHVAKSVSSEMYNNGMKITDFNVADGIVNYIYGNYEGQLGDFKGKIVTILLQGTKKETEYEIMNPLFYVSDSKIFYCIYKNRKEIKYCNSLELNQKKRIEFDNILLNKENRNEYVLYKNMDCFRNFTVITKEGKSVVVHENKLRAAIGIDCKITMKIRRMDVYEDYIYMNIELWESRTNAADLFLDREFLEFDIRNNKFTPYLK